MPDIINPTEPEDLGVEDKLVRTAGAPDPPSKRRHTKEVEVVPLTPDGDNAADIIGAWVGWYQERLSVPLPPTLISRLGRQVKGLIVTGYTTSEIKFGLVAWTYQQTRQDNLSPDRLDMLTFSYARDTRAGAQQFKTELHNWLSEVRPEVVATTNAQRRKQNNLRTLNNWRRPS